MAFFEGNQMTGGYGNGPDIINSCSVSVNKGEIVSNFRTQWCWKIYSNESNAWFT